MKATRTPIEGVFVLESPVHVDDRGWLFESYVESEFRKLGLDITWPVDVLSESGERGTLRGLHYQVGEHDLAKVVRVVAGRAFDVVVDLRRGSPTFGKHVTFTLELDGRAILVPRGCAHGFLTLADGTVLSYKMSKGFSPAHYRGIRWDAPQLAIPWPADVGVRHISEQDSRWPALDEADLP